MATLVAVLLAQGCADDAAEGSRLPAAEDAAEPAAAPDTTTSTVPNVDGWPVRTSPDGAYTMAVPLGWTLATLNGDPGELAASFLDGQPYEPAAREVVARWQEEGVHSAVTGDWGSSLPEEVAVYGPLESILITLLPEGTTTQMAVDYYRQSPPYNLMVVDAVDEVDGPRGVITRIGVKTPPMLVPEGYIYLVPDGGRLWELKMISWRGRSEGISERFALSFTPMLAGA